MPTLGQVYDYVAREMAKGQSVGHAIDLATRRWGAAWTDQAREMTGLAIAAFAAGAEMTTGPPEDLSYARHAPSVPGRAAMWTYIVEIIHNPGEMIKVVLVRDTPMTFAEAAKVARQVLRELKESDDTIPIHKDDMIIFPPSDLDDVPKGIFDVRIIRVERLGGPALN